MADILEVDYNELPSKFKGVDEAPDPARVVSWGDSWNASWESEASEEALTRILTEEMPEATPEEIDQYHAGAFNSFQYVESAYPELAHESLFPYFDDLKSVKQADFMANKLLRQIDARETQTAAPGFQQFSTDLVAGTVGSASLWAEVGLLALPPAKAVRMGYQSARGIYKATGMAALVGGGTAVDEFILSKDQELRTFTESATAVGVGTGFGFLLGGAGAALGRARTRKINPDSSETYPGSAGAEGAFGENGHAGGAAVRLDDITQAQIDEIDADPSLTPAQKTLKKMETQASGYQIEEGFMKIGRGAAKIGAFARLNPETTLAVSDSPTMVRFGAHMTNSPLLRKNQAAGEGFVNMDATARRADTNIEKRVNDIFVGNYKDYRKATRNDPDMMSEMDFNRQVQIAGTRGDAHDNPFVQKAAQQLREGYLDPMGRRGVRHKMLKGNEDGSPVAPLGDKSYYLRSFSRNFAGRMTPEQYADGLVGPYMKRLSKQAADEKIEIDAQVAKLKADAKAKGTKLEPGATAKLRRKNPKGRELKRLTKDDTKLRERFMEMRDSVMNGGDQADAHEFSMGIRMEDGQMSMSKRRTLDVATEDLPIDYLDPDPKMSIINALKSLSRQLLVYENPTFRGDPTLNYWKGLRKQEHNARLADAKSPAETEKLLKGYDRDLAYIDKIGLQYYGIRPDSPSQMASTAVANMKAFTALTGLGSVLFSTFAELGAGLSHNGVKGYIRHVSSSVLDPKRMRQYTKHEMATMDIGIQTTMGMRISEVGEYAGDMGKYSRMLHRASDRAVDKVYMLGTWTRGISAQMAAMTQSEMGYRLMKPKMSKRDLADLGRLGLSKDMFPAIQEQIAKHGEKLRGGTWNPGINSWDNQALKQHVINAINQEVDNIIIRPGVGATPFIGRTLAGSAMLQFKQFLLAATSKYGIADIQRMSLNDWRGLERQMALAGLGYMSIYLKNNYLYGPDAKKRWDGMDEKERIVEGVIQGGGGGMAYDLINLARESAYPGSSSRYYGQRSLTSMALGPNFGKVEDVYNVLGMLGAATSSEQDFSKAQLKSVMRNIPGLSFWPVRVGWPTMKDDVYELISE